eukprot:TRINITY_DN10268_c0_g1_i1.p4 TRINITY_DN10268_c0_g1~~TRINITY_DN10268_c0_g1_i1.p4  ORF type:complete len:118 (-),score=12.40 TRINITY_DN10268_c0_g1_i1:485-838(-)
MSEYAKDEITVADIKTAALDMRFPSTNQSRACYTRYNEFYKCVKNNGEDNPDCLKYRRAALSLCPMDWIEKWEDAREEGKWPGKYQQGVTACTTRRLDALAGIATSGRAVHKAVCAL